MSAANPLTNVLRESPFLKACRREPTEVTPIWLMRQAGRYAGVSRTPVEISFLELCKDPALATEVTVTAAERLEVDARDPFCRYLLILEPLGFDLEFAKGEGPVIHNPIREAADVEPGPPVARCRAAGIRDGGGLVDPIGPPSLHPVDRNLPRTLSYSGVLRDRRRGLPALRECQSLHVPRSGAWDELMSILVETPPSSISTPRPPPEPRHCSSSTVGSALSVPMITNALSNPTCDASQTNSTRTRPRFISGRMTSEFC